MNLKARLYGSQNGGSKKAATKATAGKRRQQQIHPPKRCPYLLLKSQRPRTQTKGDPSQILHALYNKQDLYALKKNCL